MHKFPCEFTQQEEKLPCLTLTELRAVRNKMDKLEKVVKDHQTAIEQEKQKKQEFGNAMKEMLESQIFFSNRHMEMLRSQIDSFDQHMESVQVYIRG